MKRINLRGDKGSEALNAAIHHYGADNIGRRARNFMRGFIDRRNSAPCRSANGAYLNGYYYTI